MSPEQAGLDTLDIDTRTDIYALGIILYELLTGQTPLDSDTIRGQAILKVLELIRDKDPVKPSSRLSHSDADTLSSMTQMRRIDLRHLQRVLIGDLDWIVMKALEKDRTRRYDSATGFADDIQRYLNNEPVEARPPSISYRLKKFTRKNRGGVFAAVLLLLALLGGTVGTTYGMWRAELARKDMEKAKDAESLKAIEANLAKEDAQLQMRRAQTAESLAEESLQREKNAKMLAEQSLVSERVAKEKAVKSLRFATKTNEILGSVFEGLDPDANYADVAEFRDALAKNLKSAVAELNRSAIGEPLDVAVLQSKLGVTLLSLGDPKPAIKVLSEAVATRTRLLGETHADTLRSMNNLASAYHIAGELETSLPLQERVLKIKTETIGRDAPETLIAIGNLAGEYLDAGRMEEALALFKEAFAGSKKIHGPSDSATLKWMRQVAQTYDIMGQPEDAAPLYEQNLTLTKAAMGPNHPDTLTAMSDLAVVYDSIGDLDRALPHYQKSLQLSKSRLGPEHPDTLAVMGNMAEALYTVGDDERAFSMTQECYKLTKLRFGPDHPYTLLAESNLALMYQRLGEIEKAMPLYQRTLAASKDTRGPNHPDTLRCLHNLAFGFIAIQEDEKALPLLQQLAEQRSEVLGETHPDTFATQHNLAFVHTRMGDLEKAIELHEKLLELSEKHLGPNHPMTLTIMGSLASEYEFADDLDKSIALQLRTLKLKTETFGLGQRDTQGTRMNLAFAYFSDGQTEEALEYYLTSLSLFLKSHGSKHVCGILVSDSFQPMTKALTERTLKQMSEASSQLSDSKPDLLIETLRSSIAVGLLLQDVDTETSRQIWSDVGDLLLNDAAKEAASKELRKSVARDLLHGLQADFPESWVTSNVKSMLGEIIINDSDPKLAEQLLKSSFQELKKRKGEIPDSLRDSSLRQSARRLIRLYEIMNRSSDADKYREELVALEEQE